MTGRQAEENAPVRCAIYTRKSTEENLELDYNSLDAQRDAAEAYITSQKHAGWVCLAEHYDDGGFSGGTTDRPAFQRLMTDVAEGRVDCIVVYKIDRLSRSLNDFSRIMDVLDRHKVSLVAVTQQFNTTTSMGRLTLNILLSFAQFERELVSERTRDKIASSRRKGRWTGGPPPLGYDRQRDNRGTRLLVNEDEAKRVRGIFNHYLQVGSIMALIRWLDEHGWRTKRYTSAKGHVRGGKGFDKATLHKLLTNVIYLGKISFQGEVYEGQHEAIVDEELFGRVQSMLDRNRHSGGKFQRNKHGALLRGLVRCGHCGCGMSHHYASKKNRLYRYYVCARAQKRGWASCPYPSLPAGDLEQFVVDQIRETCQDADLLKDVVRHTKQQLEQQIDGIRQTRTWHQKRAHRLQQDVKELMRTSEAPGVAAELAKLQDEMRETDEAIRQATQRIATLEKRMVDEDELTGAFESFKPLWDRLGPDERARVIQLLVRCIEYHGETGEIAITYHADGIKAMKEEVLSHV